MASTVQVWFGEEAYRNFGAPVQTCQRQSVTQGELQEVLHAILQRNKDECMVVVLDSEYAYQGITEWSLKWRRHEWRAAAGKVGH